MGPRGPWGPSKRYLAGRRRHLRVQFPYSYASRCFHTSFRNLLPSVPITVNQHNHTNGRSHQVALSVSRLDTWMPICAHAHLFFPTTTFKNRTWVAEESKQILRITAEIQFFFAIFWHFGVGFSDRYAGRGITLIRSQPNPRCFTQRGGQLGGSKLSQRLETSSGMLWQIILARPKRTHSKLHKNRSKRCWDARVVLEKNQNRKK